MGSPAGNSTTAARDGVLEFKTYRSPQRAGSKRGDKGENDTIPSLCSANSGTLTEMSGKAELAPSSPTDQGVVGQDEEEKTADDVMTEANGKTDEDRPLSISFDASVVTSPLGASPDVVEPYPSSTGAVTRSKTTSETTPTKTPPSSDKDGAACAGKTRNVTFSPPTPQTEVIRVMDIVSRVFCLINSVWIYLTIRFFLFRQTAKEDTNEITSPWTVSKFAVAPRSQALFALWNIFGSACRDTVNDGRCACTVAGHNGNQQGT